MDSTKSNDVDSTTSFTQMVSPLYADDHLNLSYFLFHLESLRSNSRFLRTNSLATLKKRM